MRNPLIKLLGIVFCVVAMGCSVLALENSQTARPTEILFDTNDVLRTHLYQNTDKSYAAFSPTAKNADQWGKLFEALKTAKPAQLSDLGEPLQTVHMLEITRKSDLAKFVYRLYEHGFTVEGTAVEGKAIAPAYTLPTPEAWTLFLQEAEAAFAATPDKGAYWLGLMSDKKIQEVGLQDYTTGEWRRYPQKDNPSGIIDLLRGIAVKAPVVSLDYKTALSTPPPADSMFVTIEFYNEIHYSITVGQKTLRILSSDMSYGLEYQLEGDCWLGDLRAYLAANPTKEHPGEVPNPSTGKPVIYLYPEQKTDVTVGLNFDGKLTYTYPSYGSGWQVTAQPDGTLTNHADGSTHYYLFWEGVAAKPWTYEGGFVVEGEKTEEFLRKTLPVLGLTPREYNDFITYWVPKMQENRYNLISFSGKEYDEIAKLTITPKPDSILRVHMVWQALDAPIRVEPQTLTPFERNGFTVVEWGGTEITKSAA